jgi:hypothetical protein
MMPRPLWLMIGWSLVIPIASPLLLALVLVLVPGRKGRMRTQRQTVFPAMRLEEAQPYFTQRLRHDDFVVEPSADPSRVMGIRRRPPEAQPGLDPTMIIELTFVSQADGLQVSAVAWFGELTFFDSGEGRLIDQTLERMLHGDLDREPRPLLRTFDYMAVSALVAAVLCLAAMGYLYLHSPPATIARAAMVAGLVLSCFATLFIARRPAADPPSPGRVDRPRRGGGDIRAGVDWDRRGDCDPRSSISRVNGSILERPGGCVSWITRCSSRP